MVNKVHIVGRLGKDPELRFTQNQIAVCSFSVATSDKRKDKDGQYIEETEWHNVNAWGKQAENASKYLVKGSLVYIDGRLKTRKWEDNNGVQRYSTEIQAYSIQYLSKAGDNQAPKQDTGDVNQGWDDTSMDEIPF